MLHLEPLENRVLLSFAAQINFAPVSVTVPDGYVADNGRVFADRGNGFDYGWSRSRSTGSSRSARSPDVRYDTYVKMQKKGSAVWEIQVPDGVYSVDIVAGDARSASRNYHIQAEGTDVINARASSNQRWIEGTAQVTVTDGRLTLATAKGASSNNVCFVAITQTSEAAIQYQAPITITRGGTYSGNWESNDPKTPAVTVATTDPVTIVNSNIRSAGELISASGHVDLTVRNTTGRALNPEVSSKHAGRFLDVDGWTQVTVENCEMDGTSGIYLNNYRGDHSAGQSVSILRNSAHNIDGRYSDGNGGYSRRSDDVQFFQIDGGHDLSGAEIAWNQVINDPRQSRVEDNISIYNSSGTASSPLLIHDNYIQGAYPADPGSSNYSGGGIMLSDNGSAWVNAFNNQVIATSNYGVAISSGHDNTFYGNTIISTGRLPDGSAVRSQNVGAYIWNQNHEKSFANNSGHGNIIGWVKGNKRNDFWTPDASEWINNASVPGAVTSDLEAQQFQNWQAKLRDKAVTVGPSN